MHRILKYVICLTIAAAIGNTAAADQSPINPTEDQLARILYSEAERATSGRKFFFKAWAKFAGRYIVVSYVTPQGSGLDPLPVEIAIVQFNGTTPSVVARNTFRYRAGYVNERLRIDTADYQIADSVTAFCLRTYDRDAGSGFEYNYESLDLYTEGDNRINHIAGNLAFGSQGELVSYDEYSYCNNGVSCDLVWNREIVKTILVVAHHKTKEYFDLLAKSTKTKKSGRLDQGDESAGENVQIETTMRVFRWDGEHYEAAP